MDPLGTNDDLDEFDALVAEKRAEKALDVPTPVEVASTEQAAPETPPEGEELISGEIDPEELERDGPVVAIAKGLLNGTIKAGQSISDMMATGANALTKAITGKDPGFRAPAPHEMSKINMDRKPGEPFFDPADPNAKDPLAPNTALGGVTQGATQFLWHYAMTRGVIKNPIAAGAVADFTAFKADEERFSNFLTQFDSPIVNNTFTQWLAADKDDGFLEGRFKNVIEGGALGVMVDGVMMFAKGLKNSKTALLAGDKVQATKIWQDTHKALGEFVERNRTAFKTNLDAMNIKADDAMKAKTPGADPAAMKLENSPPSMAVRKEPKFTPPDDVKQAVEEFKGLKEWAKEDVAKYLDGKLAGKIDTDMIETSDDAMAFAELLADKRLPTYETMPHTAQVQFAKQYGMPIELLKKYEKLGAVNNHVLLSSRIVLNNQAERVTGLIKGGVADDEILREVQKYDEFMNMYTSFSNIAGRTLDAHKIRGLTGETRKGVLQDFMLDKFGTEKGFQKFKEAWLNTGGDLGEITGLMKQSKLKIASDTVLEIWKNSILSGIKTFNVNFFGGAFNTVMQIPIRAFEGTVSGVRTAGQEGAERIYPGEALAMVMGDFMSLQESLATSWRLGKKAVEDMKFPELKASNLGNKAETGFVRKFSSDNWGVGTAPGATARFISKMTNGAVGENLAQQSIRNTIDTVGSAVNTPGTLLNIQDSFVESFASRQQRYALAYRRAAQEGVPMNKIAGRITELMSDQAFLEGSQDSVEAFAKRMTFKEEMGAFGQNFDRTVRSARPLNIPVLEYVFPFRRTPYNIFKQGVVDINPMFGAPQAFRAMRDPAMSGLKKDEILGRYTFGASLASAAAIMAISGNLTGAGPKDPTMRQNLMRSGWKPYSMRVQNGTDSNGNPSYKYYQYNRIEPFAYLVGTISSVIETTHYTSLLDDRREMTMAKFASAVNSSMMEATLDKSFFTGAQEFFLLANDPVRYQEQWTARFASSFVPSLSRDIETMLQDKVYLRDVRTVENAVNAKLIGKSGDVPVVRNRWGDPITIDPGWFLGARSYFSPIGMGEGYAEEIDREIVRLGIDGVETPDGPQIFRDALLAMPDRVILRNGVPIRLDPEQYSRLIEISGKEIKIPKFPGQKPMTMRDALNYLVTETEWYKAAASFPASQARLIKMVAEGYDEQARNQLIQEYPELKVKVDKAKTLSVQSSLGMPGMTEETRMKLMELMGDGAY